VTPPYDRAGYTYDGIELWHAETWRDRYSPITTLATWIGQVNTVTVREQARLGLFAGRTDGTYVAKTHANTYPEIRKAWAAEGFEYVQDEMGQATWTAVIPRSALTADGGAQRLLLILHDADYSDPNWAADAEAFYRPTLTAAAAEGLVSLIVAPDGQDDSFIYVNIVQELAVRFHLDLESVHLDVRALGRAGVRLADVPDFAYPGAARGAVDDPDARIDTLAGVPVLDITGCWQNRVSAIYQNAIADRYQHVDVHLDHIIHSEAGKRMAMGMALEHRYASTEDPALREHLAALGVVCETHQTAGQRWVSLAPSAAHDSEAPRLPLVFVFQEATALSPFQGVSAIALYHEYLELVAQEEMMVIFFALETPDDNDLAVEIIDVAAEMYPIDASRVYVTGHSHNGHLSMEFARRNHRRVAAVASLGNAYGMPAPEYSHEAVKVTDERLEAMARIDLPVIDICGHAESDFVNSPLGTQDFANAVDSWHRRARAFGLPSLSAEDIAAAKRGGDIVARRIGVPPDHSDVQYRMGAESYIGDFHTTNGDLRLRLVALEHFPHMIAPQMPALSWDFLRRFRRDQETGEIIDLYRSAF
jgi:hypothetical protein